MKHFPADLPRWVSTLFVILGRPGASVNDQFLNESWKQAFFVFLAVNWVFYFVVLRGMAWIVSVLRLREGERSDGRA